MKSGSICYQSADLAENRQVMWQRYLVSCGFETSDLARALTSPAMRAARDESSIVLISSEPAP